MIMIRDNHKNFNVESCDLQFIDLSLKISQSPTFVTQSVSASKGTNKKFSTKNT